MTGFTWATIFILIAFNAFYVIAEFATVSIRKSRVHQLAEEGNSLARRLLPIIDDAGKLDRYISICQIGITISSLVLGAFGQSRLAIELTPLFQRFGSLGPASAQSVAAVVVLVALTVLQVVIAELIPKSIALQFPERSALYTVIPMKWSGALFSWFIVILNGSAQVVLRLLKVPQGGHRHIHSPEEIDILLVESRDGGYLEPDEQERLHQALQFGIRPVHQLMVPRRQIEAVDISTPVNDVMQKIANGTYTRLPVYRGSIDNIVGILHAKDLVLHYIEHGGVNSIEQVMRPVLQVPESINANRLLSQLRSKHTQQAMVMDEFGGVEGLITLEDILAEVFGDINGDEKLQPERLPDGKVRLPGLLHLDDAQPWIGILWSGESDTVGGHVMDELGHIPAVGDHLTIDGVYVEVESLDDRMIASLIVTPLAGDEDEVHNG